MFFLNLLQNLEKSVFVSAIDRTSTALERSRAYCSIIIASSALVLDQLQHKLERTHAAGSTTDGLAHLCSIAHYLHSSAPLQTAPKWTSTWNFAKFMFGLFCEFLFLIFVVFVCFIRFPYLKKNGCCFMWGMLNSEGETWISQLVIFMLLIVVGFQILPTTDVVFLCQKIYQ